MRHTFQFSTMLCDELSRCKGPLFHKRPFNGMVKTHLKGSIICDEKSFFPMQSRIIFILYVCFSSFQLCFASQVMYVVSMFWNNSASYDFLALEPQAIIAQSQKGPGRLVRWQLTHTQKKKKTSFVLFFLGLMLGDMRFWMN